MSGHYSAVHRFLIVEIVCYKYLKIFNLKNAVEMRRMAYRGESTKKIALRCAQSLHHSTLLMASPLG